MYKYWSLLLIFVAGECLDLVKVPTEVMNHGKEKLEVRTLTTFFINIIHNLNFFF